MARRAGRLRYAEIGPRACHHATTGKLKPVHDGVPRGAAKIRSERLHYVPTLANRLIAYCNIPISALKRRLRRRFAGEIYGRLTGTGFLLIDGKQHGPVTYNIVVVGEGRFTFGRGRVEGPEALLRIACQAYGLRLVLTDGTQVEATLTALDMDSARVDLPIATLGKTGSAAG